MPLAPNFDDPAAGGGGGVTLPITESDVTNLVADLAAKVPKSLFDANTVLAATADDTPAAVTMAASTILARLAAGNIKAASVAEITALLAPSLPGYQFDYKEKTTSSSSLSATTEGTADVVMTANPVTYDGSTQILIHFFAVDVEIADGVVSQFVLYDGAASIGKLDIDIGPTGGEFGSKNLYRVLTPSAAAHTFSVRSFVGSGALTVSAGAGGNGNFMPMFMRQTRTA